MSGSGTVGLHKAGGGPGRWMPSGQAPHRLAGGIHIGRQARMRQAAGGQEAGRRQSDVAEGMPTTCKHPLKTQTHSPSG